MTGHGTPLDGRLAPRPRPRALGAAVSGAGRALHDRFVAALDDDLDLPAALSVVREILRTDLPVDERRWLVLDADIVLGLDLDRVWGAAPSEAAGLGELDPAAAALVDERTRARAARDWATADALRDRLAAMGVEVEDRPDGTTAWRVTTRGLSPAVRPARTGAEPDARGSRPADPAGSRSLQHPVEVLLREPVAFGVGQARPTPMLVADEGQPRDADRAPDGYDLRTAASQSPSRSTRLHQMSRFR